jgi:2-polyprenyl-3-methyl-5-hydroxy-6-metoxy-1,4-benzoquinol methylase
MQLSDVEKHHLDEKVYDNRGNREVLRAVPAQATTVLDVGCGAGGNARILAQLGKIADGITLSDEEAREIKPFMRQVWIHNLEEGLPAGARREAYDCVLCSHVLEHIVYPEKLLADIRQCLAQGGRLVVALPNLLYHWNRVQLLRGCFEYTNEGVMDYTHVRWYTFTSAQRMLAGHGFVVETAIVEGRFPLPGIRRFVPWTVLGRLDDWAGRTFPGLCGYQMIFVARKA